MNIFKNLENKYLKPNSSQDLKHAQARDAANWDLVLRHITILSRL